MNITREYQRLRVEGSMVAQACYLGARLFVAGVAVGCVIGAVAAWLVIGVGV